MGHASCGWLIKSLRHGWVCVGLLYFRGLAPSSIRFSAAFSRLRAALSTSSFCQLSKNTSSLLSPPSASNISQAISTKDAWGRPAGLPRLL